MIISIWQTASCVVPWSLVRTGKWATLPEWMKRLWNNARWSEGGCECVHICVLQDKTFFFLLNQVCIYANTCQRKKRRSATTPPYEDQVARVVNTFAWPGWLTRAYVNPSPLAYKANKKCHSRNRSFACLSYFCLCLYIIFFWPAYN